MVTEGTGSMVEFSRDAKEVSPVLFGWSNITNTGLKGQAQLLRPVPCY